MQELHLTMSELKGHLRKPVLVDVCITQCMNGFDPMVLEEETQGSLYKVDNKTYILAYDNQMGSQRLTTTVKLSHGVLSVVKIGEVHTRQTFAPNEWYASQYFFDGGSLVCRHFTKKLDFALTPEGGLIDVLYELWSGESSLGFYNVEYFIHT
jgi:uncharacterized beta-barrel protein YwiB (DUF1934 family)